jgi:hypothetical protein
MFMVAHMCKHVESTIMSPVLDDLRDMRSIRIAQYNVVQVSCHARLA